MSVRCRIGLHEYHVDHVEGAYAYMECERCGKRKAVCYGDPGRPDMAWVAHQEAPDASVCVRQIEYLTEALDCTVGGVHIEADGLLDIDDTIEIDGNDAGTWMSDVHIYLSVDNAPHVVLEGPMPQKKGLTR